MKKILLSAATVALLFAACKKDEDKTTPDPVDPTTSPKDTIPPSYFTIGKDTLLTRYGYLYSDGSLDFASVDLDIDPVKLNNTQINIVSLYLDTLIANNKYTYLDEKDEKFDKTKNFASAIVYAKAKIENGEIILDDNTHYKGLTGGTVEVKKNDTAYVVNYELKYEKGSLKGIYTGKLTNY